YLFLVYYGYRLDLHSFPTRRSSDLGRVSAADQVDVESMGRARFTACRTIIDTFADKLVEAVDRQAAPRDARCENDRPRPDDVVADRKSTRLNSSHDQISYAVFCLKK